ncbi:MAG: hypothetical protein ACFFD5_08050 [Candidatus Thorarchaeota archaeon]
MHNLNKKDFTPESLVNKAIKDPKILNELVENLVIKDETIRYNSHKVLLIVSEVNPDVLYPKWDFFVKLLESRNNFHKVIGIQIIANLTKIDIKQKFEDIFDIYCDLLDAKSVMTAANLAGNLGKIAKAKPNLRNKITNKLLEIEKTHHEPGRKELIKASIIESFNEYFEIENNKELIMKFVKKQLNSSSPKTRNTAEKFLKRYFKK